MEQETSNMIYFCDVNQNLSTVRHVMANSLLFWIKKGIEELEGSWKWMKKGGMIDEKKHNHFYKKKIYKLIFNKNTQCKL